MGIKMAKCWVCLPFWAAISLTIFVGTVLLSPLTLLGDGWSKMMGMDDDFTKQMWKSHNAEQKHMWNHLDPDFRDHSCKGERASSDSYPSWDSWRKQRRRMGMIQQLLEVEDPTKLTSESFRCSRRMKETLDKL